MTDELIPIQQAERVRSALLDYLTTTFALDDAHVRRALGDFLSHSHDGVFRGPYARLRLPFEPAAPGWQRAVDWRPEGLHPYAHQAAAWRRLSSSETNPTGPQATLVTTGTGSGKTESFLVPVLDHVLRTRRLGQTGMKALILYPMNALAGDQAGRLASYITSDPRLDGVRAAIYVGEGSHGRRAVDERGLITDRDAIRELAPDILLTNYKMLDQLLLRGDDQPIWQQSAASLRYLVLDEFHTYDGAQGTDVAMLLRRLGLTLKRHWAHDAPDLSAEDLEAARARPLGIITPVATSATLGGGDAAPMAVFANTVFGGGFDVDSVIGETRQTIDEWAAQGMATGGDADVLPDQIDGWLPLQLPATIEAVLAAVDRAEADAEADPATLAAAVADALVSAAVTVSGVEGEAATRWRPSQLLALMRHHPMLRRLIVAAGSPCALDDLCDALTDQPLVLAGISRERRMRFVAALLTLASHTRAVCGRDAPNVDVHLWARELSRIDRATTVTPKFVWSDDGVRANRQHAADDELAGEAETGFEFLPAIYCRQCGRSGWMTTTSISSDPIEVASQKVRQKAFEHPDHARPLISAPVEGSLALGGRSTGRRAQAQATEPVMTPGLQWLHSRDNHLSDVVPSAEDEDMRDEGVLPVLTLVGDDADQLAEDGTCPACSAKHAIRYIGSAVATMVSVAVTTLFGAAHVAAEDKKALVFTDSVQDAAHRAGFIEARSRIFTFRSVLRAAAPERAVSLPALIDRAIEQAGDDAERRYRLLPPSLVTNDRFAPFWQLSKRYTAQQRRQAVASVRRRLLFDAETEFGRYGGLGRTLELTGSVTVGLSLADSDLFAPARAAIGGDEFSGAVDGVVALGRDGHRLLMWVHGVLQRMRRDGAVHHEWLEKYVRSSGSLYSLQWGRSRAEGQPWLNADDRLPNVPYLRHGRADASISKTEQRGLENLVNAAATRSWYAAWTGAVLGVDRSAGARLMRGLLPALVERGVLRSIRPVENGKQAKGLIGYLINPDVLQVRAVKPAEWNDGAVRLECDVCHAHTVADTSTVTALDGAPCLNMRCSGRLQRQGGSDGRFYRELYRSPMRTVIAREHTGLLTGSARQRFEQGFRGQSTGPDAPNVLVATPTLELGIDIGDLSTVLLASLPPSNANYQQRVGRAGRRTGNALDLAFIRGRGRTLPVIDDPLSMIDGEVQPPATYLDAAEILQRQYVAHLLDTVATDGRAQRPQSASDVLALSLDESVLGEVVRRAHSGKPQWAPQAFLDAFGEVISTDTAAALVAWATPDADGCSGLSTRVDHARARYVAEGERIRHRIDQVRHAVDDLEVRVASPAATDDDSRDLRLARGAVALLERERSAHAGTSGDASGFWVSALEEYGLLPNYTLLDDSVELAVEFTWFDEDSGEYRSDDSMRLQRAAARAITEFAPGNTFYAGGRSILIDAVDLGVDGGAIREWVHCPECGFAEDLTGSQKTVTRCPRCGSGAIADRGQRMQVVDLARVSSQVDRDRAVIRQDEHQRRQTFFSTVTCADLDPAESTGAWYVQGLGFGADYLRHVTVRQLNLGAGRGGEPLQIAGETPTAPLFTVCSGCGKLDRMGNANTPADHRPWCQHRKARDEQNVRIALGRSLRTQGVALTLPPSLTTQDTFLLPSLRAALRLGLQIEFGGTPAHIDICETVIPDARPGEQNARGLLLHDLVPGGTGYLATFADPDRIWRMLLQIWQRLRSCACAASEVLACKHCLLPFADHDTEHVARVTALRAVESILTGGDPERAATLEQPDAAERHHWELTHEQPQLKTYDSPLEERFALGLAERLGAQGVNVRQIPGEHGATMEFHFGARGQTWRLQPQVELEGTRPDFGLAHQGGNREIMIYTDGFDYHAGRVANTVNSDADKRDLVRGSTSGRSVFSFTWSDVQSLQTKPRDAPIWWDEACQKRLLRVPQRLGTTGPMLDLVHQGPIAVMLDLVHTDTPENWERWGGYANLLPLALRGRALHVSPGTDPRRIALAELTEGPVPETQQGDIVSIWTHGAVVVVGRRSQAGMQAPWHNVLVLDDTAAGTPGFQEAWETWVQLSCLFGLDRYAKITTRSNLERDLAAEGSMRSTGLAPGIGDAATGDTLPDDWRAVAEEATEDGENEIVRMVHVLGRAVGGPAPEYGAEVADGIPVLLAFETGRIAVVYAEDLEADRPELEAAGWQAFDTRDIAGVRQRLQSTNETDRGDNA